MFDYLLNDDLCMWITVGLPLAFMCSHQLLAVSYEVESQADDSILVSDLSRICISKDAPVSVKYAAEELCEFMQRATGRNYLITQAEDSGLDGSIFVGDHPDLPDFLERHYTSTLSSDEISIIAYQGMLAINGGSLRIPCMRSTDF